MLNRSVTSPSLARRLEQPWVALPLVLVAFWAAALTTALRPGVATHMEKVSLVTSREAWARQHVGFAAMLGVAPGEVPAALRESFHRQFPPRLGAGEPEADAWLMPTWNTRPRTNKPPLLVWANMLAWSGLDPADVAPRQLVTRARLLGLGWMSLMVAAAHAAAHTLGGRRAAWVAGLSAATSLYVMRSIHAVTYDDPQAALGAVAVAAGLWAMAPTDRPTAARAGGWLACGLAVGLCMMSKSLPLALLITLLPLALAAGVWGRRGWPTAAGLGLAVAIGLAVALPWYVWMLRAYPAGTDALAGEWQAERTQPRGPLTYVPLLLGLSTPWAVWMVLGLAEPFRRAGRGRRRELLVAWLWLVPMVVAFSLHPAKATRYLQPALAPVAVMAALVLVGRMDRRRDDPAAGAAPDVTGLHWPILLVVSAVVPVLLAWPRGGAGLNLLRGAVVPAALAALLAAVLVGTCVAGIAVYRRHTAAGVALLTGVWGLIAGPAILGSVYAGTKGTSYADVAGDRLAAAVGGLPLVQLDLDGSAEPLNDDLLFHLGRIVPKVTPAVLDEVRGGLPARPVIVMAEAEEAATAALTARGGTRVTEVVDRDRGRPRTLWRLPPPVPPPPVTGG